MEFSCYFEHPPTAVTCQLPSDTSNRAEKILVSKSLTLAIWDWVKRGESVRRSDVHQKLDKACRVARPLPNCYQLLLRPMLCLEK